MVSKNGNYDGYAIDILNKLEKLIGKPFKYVYYRTWEDLLNAGKHHDVDIVFLAQQTEQRLHTYNFTDVVLIQNNKVITTVKHQAIHNAEDLLGHKVAIVKGSAISEFIKMNFPSIKLIYSKNETDSLRMILNHKAEYTIAEPVRISYYIKQNNLHNLYIAGSFPYTYKLRIATRNDIPIINIILNKALEQITPAEKKALALKWGYAQEPYFNQKLLIQIAVIGTVVLFFLIYLFMLNRRLTQAKHSLREINKTLEKRVADEVVKNREKDLLMLQQSRFAQMGQILNMIAHQWRQPLSTIMSIKQVLVVKYERQKGNLHPEDIKHFDERFTKNIEQLSSTIDDFMNFFKPNKEKSFFSLHQVMMQIIEITQPVFEQAHIQLCYPEHTEISLHGYPNELSQAIINILYNAKDALLEKKVTNPKVKIKLYADNGYVTLDIQDNAGGIPPSIIDKIFDPYFSTKDEKNGTGIGLYMTKMIIEEHMNGKITVKNTHEGACFSIKFKIA
ncbi:MAG: transporter substrate-binding domain-containing protein [Sulfurovum sp.]|nr:transporter substrate-binding domain-containing protein [Sulfurovum sp.]